MATLVDLVEWLRDLPANMQPQQEELYAAAEAQRERILTRTAQGISVDLQPFTPYSPNTKKTPPVNLRETGDMLGAIVTTADHEEAHVFINDDLQAMKAAVHNRGNGHVPQRYFFGASINDREEMVGEIRASLFRRINGGNR